MTSSSLPRYLVLDGGLSTELVHTYGIKEVNDDPLWGSRMIKDNEAALKVAHTGFLEAGCDVIETATYQGSVAGFQKHLSLGKEEAVQMLRKGVELACQARDDFWQKLEDKSGRVRPLVAASVGPYGIYLCDCSEYTGNYVDDMTTEELMSWHRAQLSAFVSSGADLIAMDTIPAQKEAQAIATLLATEKQFENVKAWLSFSCKDGLHTCHGEKLSVAADSLLHCKQIVAVGVNCTAPEHVTSLLSSLSPEIRQQKRIITYPNSGEKWGQDKSWHDADKSASLASYVPEWMDAGASWIGGCCRVGQTELAAIRKEMKVYREKLGGEQGGV